MAETTQITEQELNDLKKSWIDQFDTIGEHTLKETLKDTDLKDLTEEEIFQQLKHAAGDKKAESYLESMREEILDQLGYEARQEFPLEKYEHLKKNEIAMEMADYALYQLNIMPVDRGETQDSTDLYEYNKDTGIWEYYSDNRIGRLAKTLSEREFTQHLFRQFKSNLKNHPDYKRWQEMGTDPEEIVLTNGKKLLLDDLTDLNDLETMEVGEKDYAIHRINAQYNPEAECPQFKEFIWKLLDQKENQVKTLQEFMGWLLKFPDREFKKALLILGVTNSGKSQLAEIIELLFEKEVGQSVTNLSFPQMGFQRTFHIDKLEGSIINLDKDLSDQTIDDPSVIKKATAQEIISAEPKGDDTIRIKPMAKHIVCANVSPKIENSGDEAFYGRFLTLKAPNSVPREDRVKDLGQKIFKQEADGILNWMLKGLKRLEQQGKFTIDPSPKDTQRMWMEFGDSKARFLWETCEITRDLDEDWIRPDDLYEHYEAWIEDKMVDKMPRNRFKAKIKDTPGIEYIKKTLETGSRVHVYAGIDVNTKKIYNLEDQMVDES